MFWPYKAIIRQYINEEFYPTVHYSNIFFSCVLLLSSYIYFVVRTFLYMLVHSCMFFVRFSFPVFTTLKKTP
jgi:hypothetical protein